MAFPVVAIIGSARSEVISDPVRAKQAQQAAAQIGAALSASGFGISVYSPDPSFIESWVVGGFLSQPPAAGPGSILVYAPHNLHDRFPKEDDAQQGAFFRRRPAADEEWENAFYRSLYDADAAILIGGGYSTLVAGHIALGRGIPTVPIAAFGGNAQKIWKYVANDPGLRALSHADELTSWSPRTASVCAAALTDWHQVRVSREQEAAKRTAELQAQAAELNRLMNAQAQRAGHAATAIIAFLVFIGFLLSGLLAPTTGRMFTVVFIAGLITAGSSGSTIRVLLPNTPESSRLVALTLGAAAGLVLSLLYLLPQLVGQETFLAAPAPVSAAIRYQFVSAIVFSFIAGVGFDIVADKFKAAAADRADEVLRRRG